MAISVSKKNQQFPICPPGTYGADGSAEIAACTTVDRDGNPLKYYGREGEPACEITVKVNHPEEGVLRVRLPLRLPKSEDEQIGNKTAQTFSDLGVTEEQLEQGFDETSLVGTKVIVVVSNTPGKAGTKNEGRVFDNVDSIVKLA